MRLSIEARYGSEKVAESVYLAIGPDNAGYVKSTLGGDTIMFEMEADNVGTLRNTADDLLVCLRAAEATAGLAVRSGDETLEG